MSAPRVRAVSPAAPRVYLDTPRSSTGGLLMAGSYDPRYDVRPRSSFSTVATSRDVPSSRHNSVYETQPVSKQTYVDKAHPGTVTRTEYAIRPRRESTSAESRRPLNLVTKNPSPTRRPQVMSPGAMVTYDGPRDSREDSRFLQPSQGYQSPHHQRHNSATRAELNRYSIGPGINRAEREYHRRGPYVEKVADSRPPPPVRYSEDDAPGSFSYTTPRQQFERDLGSGTGFRPNRRESTSRRERPPNGMNERYEPAPSRQSTNPPLSSSRQLERIEREDHRRSGFESDPDRSRESRRTKHSDKGPVVHQQREEGYSSAREEYDSYGPPRSRRGEDNTTVAGRSRYQSVDYDKDRKIPREYERERNVGRSERERYDERSDDRRLEPRRERDYERERERHRPRGHDRLAPEDDARHKPRSRESSPDHAGLKAAAATAAVGGLAAVGIAKHKDRRDEDPSDSESKRERRRRRRRSHGHRDEEDRHAGSYDGETKRRERRPRSQDRDDSSGSDTPEDDSNRHRPQSRDRRRRNTYDEFGSDRDGPQLALPSPEAYRRPSRSAAEDAASSEGLQNRDIEIVPERAQQLSPVQIDRRATTPSNEDGQSRKPTLVEAGKEKKDELKPRGILKKPRTDPFPEDPNPQREGVAPLKQAGKDGVAPGARWTKISRILVNPEALEKSHERFEERQDYVIVLRVLNREEIEKLAARTRDIRAQREREWQRQAEEHQRNHSTNHRAYSDEEAGYNNAQQQLAIEAPPSAPPVDLRQLAAGQNQNIPGVGVSGPYGPQQWNNSNPGSARNSGEQVPVPAPTPAAGPGAVPAQRMAQAQPQQQSEFDASNYSQNV